MDRKKELFIVCGLCIGILVLIYVSCIYDNLGFRIAMLFLLLFVAFGSLVYWEIEDCGKEKTERRRKMIKENREYMEKMNKLRGGNKNE